MKIDRYFKPKICVISSENWGIMWDRGGCLKHCQECNISDGDFEDEKYFENEKDEYES